VTAVVPAEAITELRRIAAVADPPDRAARCADPDHVRRLALDDGGSLAWIAGLPARVPATGSDAGALGWQGPGGI
jgi:hypothetical protein